MNCIKPMLPYPSSSSKTNRTQETILRVAIPWGADPRMLHHAVVPTKCAQAVLPGIREHAQVFTAVTEFQDAFCCRFYGNTDTQSTVKNSPALLVSRTTWRRIDLYCASNKYHHPFPHLLSCYLHLHELQTPYCPENNSRWSSRIISSSK